jgi:hypothetical protein
MARAKYNFYNVYNVYYKNITEESAYFSNLKDYDFGTRFFSFFHYITERLLKNVLTFYRYIADLDRIRIVCYSRKLRKKKFYPTFFFKKVCKIEPERNFYSIYKIYNIITL